MARNYGAGSIYRRTDGYWVGQVEAGRDTKGKRKTRRVVRRTRADVVRALPELRRQADAGIAPGQSRSVADYLTWWVENVLPASGVKPSTVAAYRHSLDRYVVPRIGHKRLGKLNPGDVQMMLRSLELDGLAPRTRAQVRMVLSRALRWAEQTDLLPRNVASLVQGPRVPRRTSDALTADEARAVLAAAAGDRCEILAVLALRLGMRRGEMLALRWTDVDLGLRDVTVRGAKTEAGDRTLPLLPDVHRALVDHRRRQVADQLEAGPLWRDRGLVLDRGDGEPLNPRVALRYWHGWTTAASLGPRRLHAARHTCATLLLEDGVPLEIVSAILGHAGISITADIYGRIGMDAKRRALAGIHDTNGGAL